MFWVVWFPQSPYSEAWFMLSQACASPCSFSSSTRLSPESACNNRRLRSRLRKTPIVARVLQSCDREGVGAFSRIRAGVPLQHGLEVQIAYQAMQIIGVQPQQPGGFRVVAAGLLHRTDDKLLLRFAHCIVECFRERAGRRGFLQDLRSG